MTRAAKHEGSARTRNFTRRMILLAAGMLLLGADLAPGAAPPPNNRPPRKGPTTTRKTLPRDHEYQRVLRDHLKSLTPKDFTHGVNALLAVQPVGTDPDYLYRNYVLTLMNQPLVGTKRGVPAINAPPSLFLLSSIETPQGLMRPPVWPETLISFVQWDYPGNPYRNNRALKLRAFVTATVMMVMLDDLFDANPDLGRGDWFSYQLVYFGLPYPGFKDVLPPAVQKAYEAGLKKMGERVLGWGIKGEEPQSDLIAPFGLFCVARAINDAGFTRVVEAYARKLYTDPRYFNPAGYWNYRGGLDIPFNGQAYFWAVSTGLASDWPFVKEALDRAYRLRGHLILPEPDGKLTGPSHFNSRLSGPASADQWAWNGARDTAAAMLTDEAAHLVKLPSPDILRDAPGKRANMFAEDIRENPRDDKGRHIRADEIISHPWKWRVWMTFNFPASVNPGYEFYPKGAYARRFALEKKDSPLLHSPFERKEAFMRSFGKDFLVARQPGYAAILHTGPIGLQDPEDKMHQFTGPMGLSGGQLSAFWMPATGSVILGQRGGMTYDKSFDQVAAWRTWPNHSVNGLTANGVFFSSARIQKPDAIIDVRRDRASVKVSGTIPASIVGQEKAITGKYDYARSFQIDETGVHVTTTISGDGKEQIAELYETLPIYLHDTKAQPAAVPTVIEFQISGKWVPATDTFREKVQTVRLTRFKGAVLVTFDQPRRVKLSPAVWKDTYLSRATSRNVLIDLMENGDRPAFLTKTRQVGYRIEPVAR